MQIDIDLTQSPEALANTKIELEVALNAVIGAIALREVEKKRTSTLSKSDEELINAMRIPKTPITVTPSIVVMQLKDVFTMREARDAAAAAGVSNQRIRNEIARQIKGGHLLEIEKGKGRTPSSFKKCGLG